MKNKKREFKFTWEKNLLLILIGVFILFYSLGGITAQAWNTSTATWDGPGSNFSVAAQGPPAGIFFNSTGTKMFIIDFINDRVYQYTLSQAWNTSTATWDGPGSNFSVSGQDTLPYGIFFNSTGTKMYIIGVSSSKVHQYTLSQAWNTSTATYDGTGSDFSVAAQDTGSVGIFFNSTGTKMYMVGQAHDRVYQYTLSQAWNVSTATWDGPGSNLSIGSQDGNAYGIFFSSLGTKMFILGQSNGRVYQYTLSQAWNVSSATWDGPGSNFSIAAQDQSNAIGLFFNSSGAKMFITGNTNNRVYQYTLIDNPPQWSQSSSNSTLAGTLINHIVNWTDDVVLSGYIFSFDNGTGSFTNDTFVTFTGTTNFSNVSKVVNTTVGSTIRWRVFANDSANQFNSTSIFSYVTTSAGGGGAITTPTSKLVGFDATNGNNYNTSNVALDAGKWYTITVHGYRLGGASAITSITHDPTGTPLEFTLISGAREIWSNTRDVEIWAVRPNSTTANASIWIQWPGSQSETGWTLTEWSAGVNSTNFSRQVVVNNGTSGTSSSVTMASYGSSNNAVFFVTAIGGSGSGDPADDIKAQEGRTELADIDDTDKIEHADFYQNPNGGDTTLTANWTNSFDWGAIGIEVLAGAAGDNPPKWFQNSTRGGVAWDISSAVWDGPGSNFSTTTQSASPRGIFFNSSGNKMYITGVNRVYQYTLSQPWNTSTVVWDGPSSNFSVAAQDANPRGIFFNSTGTKMWIIGLSSDRVYQYTLPEPWDISTATWDGPSSNLSVSGQDASPYGIFFNSSGTKMYISGQDNSQVYQYTLSQAWNISTATWDGPGSNLSVSAQDTSPAGIFFNSSGTKMYISGQDNSQVYQYTLSQAWNTSTATYDGANSDLNTVAQDSIPGGIFINSTGTKMFMIGADNSRVYQYTTSESNTGAGKFIRHSVNWTDDTALSGYIFEFDNGTGTFANDTFVTFTGTQNWSNVSKTVNTTVGSTIRWRVYSNDSLNQFNSTSIFSYVTTGTDNPPQWFQSSTNGTVNGTFILHSINWTDDTALSGYIFEFDNGTGTFANDTFVTFTGTQNWSNVSKTVNTTVGSTIRWRVYSNDSLNQFGSTSIFSYVTTPFGSNSKLFIFGANNYIKFAGNSVIKLFR